MAQAIGTLIGIVLLMMLFSFFVYFSGWIGLFAAVGALIGGGLLVALASASKLALRIFSSRAWLIPIALFATMLALSPLLFERNFCSAQLESGTASQLFDLPGETPGKIYSASLEGECLAAGGLGWSMQQPTGIVRVVLFLAGLLLFGFAFSGKREPPPPPPPPVRKESQLGDFPPELAARLKVPPVPLQPSADGTINKWTPEMSALLSEAAKLNGGFLESAVMERLAREPAFSNVTTRGMVAKARALGIEYQKAQTFDG